VKYTGIRLVDFEVKIKEKGCTYKILAEKYLEKCPHG
jgi:hypothetical protein